MENNETLELILTMGLPASGKSTWAKEKVATSPEKYKRINNDDMRAMLDCSVFTRRNETFMGKMRDQMIRSALENGFNVIVDNTNLSPKHWNRYTGLANGLKKRGIDVRVTVKSFMHVSLDECIERNKMREESVPENVIREMYQTFVKNLARKKYPFHLNYNKDTSDVDREEKISRAEVMPDYDENKPDCIVVDLDGTLFALGDRSPYDTNLCHLDNVNRDVMEIVNRFLDDVTIFFVTGRNDEFSKVTRKCIEDKIGLNSSHYQLFMRPIEDQRRDSIVKSEILREQIMPCYNILFALDDRTRVVKSYRALGIRCFQVQDGDY